MTRYLVQTDAVGFPKHEAYQDAATPEDAAQAAARAWYSDARAEFARDGKDLYGEFRQFTARTSYSRLPATIRVRWTR